MTKNVYTVGQVNKYIKNMFAQDFMMNRIYVKGEVSNCKYHTSGHVYFTLKDETGSISAVMFAGNARNQSFRMRDGDNVIVLGSIEVYERDGKYQLYAKEILADGQGLLYQRFEVLKKELEEMGMFAPEYKQPIPKYVKTVGVVTAPTGAAVQDIRNITGRRNPYVQVILYPAKVQGEQAAASIVEGIRTLDRMNLDVLIVGRGGGSIEDLWAFNEEEVARAVFECRTPVISAVGHETDTTIIDFVADLRAPTPSAAAELAVYDIRDLLKELSGYRQLLEYGLHRKIEEKRARLEQMQMRLQAVSPASRLNEKKQMLADAENALHSIFQDRIKQLRYTVGITAERLEGNSPLKKLSTGYAYVADENRQAIRDVSAVKEGERIQVHLLNGTLKARVEEISAVRRGDHEE